MWEKNGKYQAAVMEFSSSPVNIQQHQNNPGKKPAVINKNKKKQHNLSIQES